MTYKCFVDALYLHGEMKEKSEKKRKGGFFSRNKTPLFQKPSREKVQEIADAIWRESFPSGAGKDAEGKGKETPIDELRKHELHFDAHFVRSELVRGSILDEYVAADGGEAAAKFQGDSEKKKVLSGLKFGGERARKRNNRKTLYHQHFLLMGLYAAVILAVCGGVIGACVTVYTETCLRERALETEIASAKAVTGVEA